MELAGETFYDRRESGLDIKIQNQQVRPTPDGYGRPAAKALGRCATISWSSSNQVVLLVIIYSYY